MVATAPVTVEQAAAILGISASTVRRRIRAGTLRAEEARRPQGAVWLVSLPEDALPDAGQASPAAAPVATAPAAQTEALATWAASLLVPIAAELGEARQTIERQAAQLVGKEQEIGVIREERGRLTAELERAASTVAALDDALTAHRRRIRAAAIIAAVLAALALAAGIMVATGWLR